MQRFEGGEIGGRGLAETQLLDYTLIHCYFAQLLECFDDGHCYLFAMLFYLPLC